MATIDTTDARIEEASHAVVNLLTTKKYPQDRLKSIRVVVLENGTTDARVETDFGEITAWLLTTIPRGKLLADFTNEQKSSLLGRISTKAQMVVGGQAGVDIYKSKEVRHLLDGYSFREAWYADTVKAQTWALRDSDKALLIAYFTEVKDRRVIALGSPVEWDFLKPISNVYATNPELSELLNNFVHARTVEAVSLLRENWGAVLKIADELKRRPFLTLQDVLQLLVEFPSVVSGIETVA